MSTNDDFSLLDDEQSPSKTNARTHSKGASYGTQSSKTSAEAEKAHEDALRQELASVRKVNEAIEGVLESLQKAKSNMKVGERFAFVRKTVLTFHRLSTQQLVLLHSYSIPGRAYCRKQSTIKD